jgi:hypothetical protein
MTPSTANPTLPVRDSGFLPLSSAAAVSWSAVFAGAAAAAAISLILLFLGVGLGLSAVSPWAQEGVSGTTFGVSTILWISFVQLAASALGGYLAGRLRVRWTATDSDEVYFRDTAHGFLAWAVASLATAALLSSAVGAVLHTGAQAVAAGTGAAAATTATVSAASSGGRGPGTGPSGASDETGSVRYFVDSLFRRDASGAAAASANPTNASTGTPGLASVTPGSLYSGVVPPQNAAAWSAEADRIYMANLRVGVLPAEDVRHIGQLVAQRTGLSQQEAERRVTENYARLQANLKQAADTAKEAADKARKASAYASLWFFIALLIGAFTASFMAIFGGRQRDA